ncbi:hypothetical protein [Paenibacillus lutimineralis]|uniref:Uncharacterized protein n=1 Tax=Paenibacillus lutimineralis TaxID=2707005 RepID=A0A3Q9I996_9BACL|nr:hypothetical protein [Paenibacillus lutimineralis]AZS14027.1 hypothetical protein EI981_05875 [Paenibacillus lutimineralis]
MLRTLGINAIYDEKEYEFIDLDDGTFALISNDNNDLNRGFVKVINSSNRFIKYVKLEELSFIYQKDTEVKYKGDIFIGSIIEGNQIMLYTRDVPLGKKHNMMMRDKDEYYLHVDLKEVDEIIQILKPLSQYTKK